MEQKLLVRRYFISFVTIAKYVHNFGHHLHHHVSHCIIWWYFRVGFKAFEEVLDTLERLAKASCAEIHGSLTDITVERPSTTNQEENTDTGRASEITLASKNIYEKN
jgi:hypothetical protein